MVPSTAGVAARGSGLRLRARTRQSAQRLRYRSPAHRPSGARTEHRLAHRSPRGAELGSDRRTFLRYHLRAGAAGSEALPTAGSEARRPHPTARRWAYTFRGSFSAGRPGHTTWCPKAAGSGSIRPPPPYRGLRHEIPAAYSFGHRVPRARQTTAKQPQSQPVKTTSKSAQSLAKHRSH